MSSLRPEGSRRKVMSEINVVPYIDVMLVRDSYGVGAVC